MASKNINPKKVDGSALPTSNSGLGSDDLWQDNGSVRVGTSTPTGSSSIYTADGTLSGDRIVDLNGNDLDFKDGDLSASLTSYIGTSNPKGKFFSIPTNRAGYLDGSLWFRNLNNSTGTITPHHRFYSGGLPSYVGASNQQFLFGKTNNDSGAKFEMLAQYSGMFIHNNAPVTKSFLGLLHLYPDTGNGTVALNVENPVGSIIMARANSNREVILRGTNVIGSETISLQGSTLIKGEGTSTGSTLALYDNDTTPNKTWEWLDSGNVVVGQDVNFIGDSASVGSLKLYRPANGTNYGAGFDIDLNNSSNIQTNYGRFGAQVVTNTSGSEYGKSYVAATKNGAVTVISYFDSVNGLSIEPVTTTNLLKAGDVLTVSTADVTVKDVSGSGTGLQIYRANGGVNAGVGFNIDLHNSSSAQATYARFVSIIESNTAGSHTGRLELKVSDSGTVTTKVAVKTNTINVNMPTSSSGLSAGDLWNENGVVRIGTSGGAIGGDNIASANLTFDGTYYADLNGNDWSIKDGSDSYFNIKSTGEFVIGKGAQNLSTSAQKEWNTIIGYNAETTAANVRGTVSIGYNATTSNTAAVAIGNNSISSGSSSIAILGTATKSDSIAIGKNTNATGNFRSIAIGTNSSATYNQAVAIGSTAQATGNFAQAFGTGANATQNSALAVGYLSKSSAIQGIAIGTNNEVVLNHNNSIVIGSGVSNTAGNQLSSTSANQFVVGFDSINPTILIGATSDSYIKSTGNLSLETNTTVKGSDNSASTSGFKIVDTNDASKWDFRNDGNVHLGQSTTFNSTAAEIIKLTTTSSANSYLSLNSNSTSQNISLRLEQGGAAKYNVGSWNSIFTIYSFATSTSPFTIDSSNAIEMTGNVSSTSTSSIAAFIAKGDGTTDGYIQLNCSQNSHGIKLKSPAHSAGQSYTLTFPINTGNNGEVLKTDGSGVLSWGTAGSSSPLTTKGDLYTYGTADTRLPLGTNGQALVVDTTEPTGLKYVNISETATVGGGLLVDLGMASTDQSITVAAGATIINFDDTLTGAIDTNGDWDNTNKKFVVSSTSGDGTYQFEVNLFAQNTTAGYYNLQAFVNGSIKPLNGAFAMSDAVDDSGYDGVAGTISIDLVVGDEVEIKLQSYNTTTTISANTWNFAQGMRISKASGIKGDKGDPGTGAPVSLSKTLTLQEPTASDDITVFRTDVAITVQEVIACSTGTSPDTTYQLKHHTDRSNAGNALTTSAATTSTTTGDVASLSDATIPANSWVWIETSAASGTSVYLSVDIRYTED